MYQDLAGTLGKVGECYAQSGSEEGIRSIAGMKGRTLRKVNSKL